MIDAIFWWTGALVYLVGGGMLLLVGMLVLADRIIWHLGWAVPFLQWVRDERFRALLKAKDEEREGK